MAERFPLTSALVPMDGSIRARGVLPHLLRLAGSRRIDVTLLRVVPPVLGPGGGPRWEEIRARNDLERVRRDLERRGVQVRAEVVRDRDPVHAILRRARAGGPSLIAMTTHARTGAGRAVLGSVAEGVVRRSPVPVLVVGPGSAGRGGGAMRRILVPLDGSAASGRILPLAASVARLHKSHVSLLHVAPPLSSVAVEHAVALPYLPVELAPAAMAPYRDALTAAGIRARLDIVTGGASRRILERVRQTRPDLVVMATRGRTGIGRWILGSVAEQVLRRAPGPILLWAPGSVRAARSARAKGTVLL